MRGKKDVKFQENPSKGTQDTDEELICFPIKMQFIIDRSQQKLHLL